MIRDLLNKLPAQVLRQVRNYRADYTRWKKYAESDDEGYANIGRRYIDETRERMGGYALGLMHAGLITERERRYLFVYMTIPISQKEEA